MLGIIRNMIPVTQEVIDVAVEGLVAAVLLQEGLNDLVDKLGEAAYLTVKGLNIILKGIDISMQGPVVNKLPDDFDKLLKEDGPTPDWMFGLNTKFVKSKIPENMGNTKAQ